MKISAVYIAKNEAHNIARSLESIKDAADELILVDTGSTDETVNIFKSYGGKVFFQEWADDFSAPRNLALSKATGDWIIILDADESFSEATRKNIKTVLKSCSPEAKGLLINMVNYDKDTGEELDEFYQLRIVRNVKELNYKGRIHEMLYIGNDNFYGMQRVAPELLSIDHTGYTASISQEKNQRNIRLMEAAIAAGEPEDRYYTSLYESYTILGNMEKALYYARLDVERGRQPITYASRSYRGLMAHYAKDNSKEGMEKRLQLAEKAVKDFPELPDFHAEYSECLCQHGRYKEAKKEIDLAISLFKDYNGLEPCLLTSEMVPLMEKRQQEITKLAGNKMRIKISACAITKNEEKNIYSWLDNVKTFADEIIINDTGSADRTKAIIGQFSEENPDIDIMLIESIWQDDFSFAKNQCIAEATGDWIVFTDADELFLSPEKIRAYLGGLSNTDTQIIMVPMANVDTDDNNSIINVFSVPRIFRREDGLRYEGRIHETIAINDIGAERLKTTYGDKRLFMEHTGYSSGIHEEKAKRNLRLLLRDIEDGQNIKKLYRYLAESYYALGDYNQALENALQATQSEYQPIGHQGDMYWLALNAMEKLEYAADDKMSIVDNGINLFPELPDFYGRKAMILCETKNYHQAIKLFEQAVDKMSEYNKESVHKEASNMVSIMHQLFSDWGACLYRSGFSQQAEEKYQKALDINPWTEKALCGWAAIYQGRLDKDFLAKIDDIYGELENSQELLAGIFAVNGFPELAGHFTKVKYSSLIKEKSYETIYNKSMKEIAEILPFLYVCLLEKYNEEYVKLLPDKLQCLIRYFHDKPGTVSIDNCFDEYISLLDEVMNFASTEVLERYLGLLESFSTTQQEAEQQLLKVAEMFLKNYQTEKALELYQRIPADSANVDGTFWQQVGICLYELGQYEVALEVLAKGETSCKTDTYVTWCREAMENGN
ncbi:Glycosyl transferase, group 2 family protein [Anaerovibrio sp. JC8]|uniref:glycosyltransferase n=1 Tax=Anaerovibrio sp. JC8 TaxID=1240085 RepID=UPI000A0E306D|nr:glycosyltransferase [Anaerovibrio sp. JC8]ORU00581.1 Glycosyl transferase, group 2 family protein [Anaerovibrio sp. JC8]